jgi:hypothetical protein
MGAVAAVQDSPDNEPIGIDNLTAAEVAMAERKAGQSITSLANDALPKVSLMGALGWVQARRSDVKLTYDAYMNGHTLTEILTELGMSADEDEQEDDEGKDDEST